MLKRIALLFSLVMIFSLSFAFATEDVLLIAPNPNATTNEVSGEQAISGDITEVVSGEVVTDENNSEEIVSGEVEKSDDTTNNVPNENVPTEDEHDHDHDHNTSTNVAGAIIAIVIVIAVVAIVAVLQKK